MNQVERTATTTDGDWLTLAEAAHFLGVRSPFAVVRWLSARLLAGAGQDGQVFASRRAVDPAATHRAVAAERTYEATMNQVLAECPDTEPEEIADLTRMTYGGRPAQPPIVVLPLYR